MTEPTSAAVVAELSAIPDQLEQLATRVAHGAPAPTVADAWTPSEIAGHLCDAARYWGARMRRVVHEDEPTLETFDENMLVRLGAHQYWPLDDLLREFRLLSEANVAFLRGLASEQWERAGVHETRGRLTLREIVAIEADHEQGHARQLAQTVGAARSS